ncbi:hypothetical protein DFH09DRAFT_1087392 [Mycena vulgaris]|nr:hypothetical protein DFH09DRAFT_1087392 [Mycena vulgaris]
MIEERTDQAQQVSKYRGLMVGKKRERKRVPKEERKNLRLWAEGARESILRPHLDGYTAALDQGCRAERKYWKQVCNEFHARVNWRTADTEEPILAEWDPAAPLQKEMLTDEEEVLKGTRVNELNSRIRRWFTYRIRRLRKHRRTAGLDPTKDPFAVLLARLSGLSAPPKARQAYQQFMKESYHEKIALAVADRWSQLKAQGEVTTKDPKAGFRASIAREVFANLPSSEQKALGARAKKQAAEAKAAYTLALKNPPSKSPAARQQCIDRLSEFMGPILQGLHDYTGLHATVILGGPMPKLGGEFISYGRNETAMAHHCGQWDKGRFKENVEGFMIDYLKTAFTLADSSVLDSAKYIIDSGKSSTPAPDNNSDSGSSDSDSDSDSDSESDSEVGSDEEEAARPRKKTKVPTDKDSAAERCRAERMFPLGLSEITLFGENLKCSNPLRIIPFLVFLRKLTDAMWRC